jgi:hypothetical protein
MSSKFVWDLSDCFDQKRLTEYVAKCMSSEFDKAMREKHEDNGRGYFDRYDFIMGEIAEKYISSIDEEFGEEFNIKVQEALLDQLKNIDNCYRPINVMQKKIVEIVTDYINRNHDQIQSYIEEQLDAAIKNNVNEALVRGIRNAIDLDTIVENTLRKAMHE